MKEVEDGVSTTPRSMLLCKALAQSNIAQTVAQAHPRAAWG